MGAHLPPMHPHCRRREPCDVHEHASGSRLGSGRLDATRPCGAALSSSASEGDSQRWPARSLARARLARPLRRRDPRAGAPAAPSHNRTISASLDPAKRHVRGHVQIALTNTSERPLAELVFHLYLNAFRDERSVFMRESGGLLRGERFDEPGLDHASARCSAGGVDAARPARSASSSAATSRSSRCRLPTAARAGRAALLIESDFVVQAAVRLRAQRLRGRLLRGRTVVSQARQARARRPLRELSVSRARRVLRRLRRLRGQRGHAARVRGRRERHARPASANTARASRAS